MASPYDRAGDLHFDYRTDALMYLGVEVPRRIREEAERMAKQGAPRLVIEEYVAQMMRFAHQRGSVSLEKLAREYPDLMRAAPPLPPPQQPTHRKEILCLL